MNRHREGSKGSMCLNGLDGVNPDLRRRLRIEPLPENVKTVWLEIVRRILDPETNNREPQLSK